MGNKFIVSYNLDDLQYIIIQQPKSEVLLMIRPSKNLRLLKSKAEHPSAEVDWKACLAKHRVRQKDRLFLAVLLSIARLRMHWRHCNVAAGSDWVRFAVGTYGRYIHRLLPPQFKKPPLGGFSLRAL